MKNVQVLYQVGRHASPDPTALALADLDKNARYLSCSISLTMLADNL
jgi:hypothetical protein